MADLVDQKLGQVGELKIGFENGLIKLSLVANESLLSGGIVAQQAVSVLVSPQVFVKLIEDAIPGDVDNAILDALTKALLPAAPAPQA